MKKIVALCLSLVLSLGLLAGCGDGGSGASSDKILRMGISSINGIFNPIMTDQKYDSWVCDLVFDKLVTNNKEGEYVPGCATWELSEDHLTYTFTLKDGITFSDGTAMTAEDVAFTYTTIADPAYDGPRSYAVSGLVGYDEYSSGSADTFEGIKVIDEKTISFTFRAGQESPANINCFQYGILPKAIYTFSSWDEFKAKNDQPVGSGQFIFDSWALNEHVTLNTRADYWDKDRQIKFGGLVLVNVPDESIIGALQANEIDYGQPSATTENYDEINSIDGVSAITYLGNGYTYLQFNCTLPKLQDVRVRQALMFALDRKAFIESYYGDIASVGMAPISPVSWAFPDAGDMEAYDYDQAKAAELMDAAGWEMGDDGYRYKDGEKFTVSWLVYEDAPWPGILAGMAYDSWKELGVDLVIEKMDFGTVQSRTSVPEPGEKDFEIYTMGFSLDIDPNPEGALYDAEAYRAGGFNASGFRDERSQELQQQGKVEFDQAKRAEIYKEWGALQTELIPTVIVAYRNEVWGVRDTVKGLDLSAYIEWPMILHNVTIS